MNFSNWLRKQPDLQQDISLPPKVEIAKEAFDVASNPFKFIGKRVEGITFFDGKVNSDDLEQKARYVSRFNQPHNTYRRSIAISPELKLQLSENLSITRIYLTGTITIEMYRQAILSSHPAGDLPPELAHIKSPIKIRYPVQLPANLTWEMYRNEVQDILGVPNLSKFNSAMPLVGIEQATHEDIYYYTEGCIKLTYHDNDQILNYLEICQLPEDLDTTKQSLPSYFTICS